MPVCWFCEILPPVHQKVCGTVRTSCGPNSKRDCVCLDSGEYGGVYDIGVLPASCSDIWFSYRGRPFYTGHRQPLAYLRLEASSTSSMEIGRLLSLMPAIVSGCPRGGICTTRREMLVAVTMCTYFRSYLRGTQFTLRTDHRSLRWLQKFRNSYGMLARWYSSRLPSNIDRGLSTPTQMAFLVNVVSACIRTVRSRRRMLVLGKPARRRIC